MIECLTHHWDWPRFRALDANLKATPTISQYFFQDELGESCYSYISAAQRRAAHINNSHIVQFENINFRFNKMEISLQKSWDSGDAISNPQNVDEHLSTSNIRSIDTGETTKVAHSSPPGPLHNLSSNFQSETMPTASEMTGISENASELGRTLLRAYISNNSSYTGFMPPASAGTSRREMTYLEPNAPVTRTGVHDQGWEFGVPVRRAWLGGQSHTHGARPKRNRVTLVQEEEMNSFREDRAGTPHMSELLAEDNIVKAFSVEELGMEREFHTLVEARHHNQSMLSSRFRGQGPSRHF